MYTIEDLILPNPIYVPVQCVYAIVCCMGTQCVCSVTRAHTHTHYTYWPLSLGAQQSVILFTHYVQYWMTASAVHCGLQVGGVAYSTHPCKLVNLLPGYSLCDYILNT